MTNDELQALCERNAKAIDTLVVEFIRPLAQQSVATQAIVDANAKAIANLTKVADDTAAESADNENRIAANEARFQNLLEEARADRAEWRTQLEADRAEWRTQLEADRAESTRRFDAQQSEIAEARAKAEEDRQTTEEESRQWQANFNAQQEILQRLLLEIRSTNGAVAGLSDRVEGLEAG